MSAIPRVLWHEKFNLPALLDRASRLRNVPCFCDLPRRPISGGLNWVIFLTFEDGVEWVFRSPTIGDYEISLEDVGELLRQALLEERGANNIGLHKYDLEKYVEGRR